MESEIEGPEPVSEAVVRAVSAVTGREPQSLPPLAGVLDPGALDDVFSPRAGGEPRPGGRISFVYGGCLISVDNGEYLTIQPIADRFVTNGDGRRPAIGGSERDDD